MVGDDRVLLPLPVQALIGLLVDLQRPVGIPVPDDVVSPGLKVQPVPAGRRVGQQQIHLSRVPYLLIGGPLVHPHP